ncbi:hypothetical protein [Haloferax sp. DFSO52]|uniref:hypothetical protein n=1 Tax=Haloferax sp. DFSO52 TaxID=3388505 RepID=UPI003A854D3D
MRGSKLITAVMVIAMLTVAMVPGAVAAADSDQSLQVSVEQDAETGNATVTVTQNDTNNTTVDNATVVVESSANYSGNDTYQTDADGTVELPNPDERVNVTLNVSTEDGNNSTTVEAELIPHSESLDISVDTDDANDTVTATVTQYGDAVDNATVKVNGTDYDNTSSETDENGTVSFDEPMNTTNLTFVASANNETAETTVEVSGIDLALSVEKVDNTTVVINVTEDGQPVEDANVTVTGDYTDAGDYETDENGTVDLAAPLQNNTTIEVTAEYEGDTVSKTVTFDGEVAEDDPFGALVTKFIERLKQNTIEGPMGQKVSEFVTEHNPGKADEKRPDHAGKKDKGEQGPPDHAKKDADAEDTEDDSEEDDESKNNGTDKDKSNKGQGSGND